MMKYKFIHSLQADSKLRGSFNELALATFDLSFEDWYQAGYWSPKYQTYSYCLGNRVVANVSASTLSFELSNQTINALQIGTVMTDMAFRGQGLASRLVEEVIKEWKSKSDLIYLYANDESASFYPKFGFERAYEYTYSCDTSSFSPSSIELVKLDLSKSEDLELLRQMYAQNNPFSTVKMIDNFELLMFYCGSFFADSIYYIAEFELVVIAQAEGQELHCFDIYGEADCSLEEVLRYLVSLQPDSEQISLGFTPIESGLLAQAPILDYDNLFVLRGTKCSTLFDEAHLILPLLSHA